MILDTGSISNSKSTLQWEKKRLALMLQSRFLKTKGFGSWDRLKPATRPNWIQSINKKWTKLNNKSYFMLHHNFKHNLKKLLLCLNLIRPAPFSCQTQFAGIRALWMWQLLSGRRKHQPHVITLFTAQPIRYATRKAFTMLTSVRVGVEFKSYTTIHHLKPTSPEWVGAKDHCCFSL